MNKRNITLGIATSLSVLIAGCASTPPDNAMVSEARASYAKIKDDPDVARSGDRQLRSARDQLNRAESLLDRPPTLRIVTPRLPMSKANVQDCRARLTLPKSVVAN